MVMNVFIPLDLRQDILQIEHPEIDLSGLPGKCRISRLYYDYKHSPLTVAKLYIHPLYKCTVT